MRRDLEIRSRRRDEVGGNLAVYGDERGLLPSACMRLFDDGSDRVEGRDDGSLLRADESTKCINYEPDAWPQCAGQMLTEPAMMNCCFVGSTVFQQRRFLSTCVGDIMAGRLQRMTGLSAHRAAAFTVRPSCQFFARSRGAAGCPAAGQKLGLK